MAKTAICDTAFLLFTILRQNSDCVPMVAKGEDCIYSILELEPALDFGHRTSIYFKYGHYTLLSVSYTVAV